MSEGDLKFLVSLGQKYGLGQSATPELRDTIFRVGMKEIIQSWERGEIPARIAVDWCFKRVKSAIGKKERDCVFRKRSASMSADTVRSAFLYRWFGVRGSGPEGSRAIRLLLQFTRTEELAFFISRTKGFASQGNNVRSLSLTRK